jgi:hypothetical protein
VFLVTANFGSAAPASAAQPHPRPPAVPGTFRLLVLENARGSARAPPGEHP